MQDLFNYISTITPFSDQGKEILQSTLTCLEIKKGTYLLKEGEVANAIFYINKGYCRAYHNKDREEINTMFYFENSFATNIKSLTSNARSEYAIQACEDMTTTKLDKVKLLEAYKISHEIETFGRKLLEIIIAKQEEHTALFKLLSARERYEYLQKNQPDILQRISLTQISSYLGISRETLSRIRGRKTGK